MAAWKKITVRGASALKWILPNPITHVSRVTLNFVNVDFVLNISFALGLLVRTKYMRLFDNNIYYN